MDCRTPITIEFRTRLGYNQIKTKEQSVVSKRIKTFSSGKILL